MNEVPVAQPEQIATAPLPSRRVDPLRRWTLAILVVFLLLFGWTLVADRLTPYTSDASVRAFVVRIVPEVSGKVIEVAVRDNQIVRTGDLLYRIDPTPFRITVERAEAKLAAAGQAVGASTAAVDEAQAQLVQELAQRDNVREQAARVFELVRTGVYAASKRDQAEAELWARPRRRCSGPRPRSSRRARRSAPRVPTIRRSATRWQHSSRHASISPAPRSARPAMVW
jgi:multidrug resistance efflux pump